MTEPISTSSLMKWGGGMIVGAVTVAAAAVDPSALASVTPSLDTSVTTLIAAAIALYLKTQIPSEKTIASRFDVLESQHKTLSAAVAEATDESQRFRIELSRWCGRVDEKLDQIEERKS